MLRAVGSVVAILAAYYLAPLEGGPRAHAIIRPVVAMSAVVAISVWEVLAVYRSSRPLQRALTALAVSATTVVVAFAVLYLNLSARDPAAFSEPLDRTGALYFTMTTLATVGYGDITATTDGARIAVMVQMVFNVLVIGTAVKVIMGTVRRGRDASRPTPSSG